MNARRLRNQTARQGSERMRKKRITPPIKAAMLNYYESERAKGKRSREQILETLARHRGKTVRRIEGYIADARRAGEEKLEEQTFNIVKRAGQLQDFEKIHGGSVRNIAGRLQSDIAVPTPWDIYDLPSRDRYQCGSGIYWRLLRSGKVDMTLSLENEDDTRHLYSALMSHLTTGDFPDAPVMIESWKSMLVNHLQQCYSLLNSIRNDLKSELKVDIPHRYAKSTPGPTAWFPLTVCIVALQTAGGSTATRSLEYETYPLDKGLYALKYGAVTIAIADSEQKLDRYREFQDKFQARLAGSGEVAAIAEIRNKLSDRVARISDELSKFALTTPVPGQCDYCKAS